MSQWAATGYIGLVWLSLSVYIARQIGPANYGEYSVVLSAGAILAIFIDGGMRNLLLRERTRASVHLIYLSEQLPAIALGHAMTIAIVASLLGVILLAEKKILALAMVWSIFGVVLAQYVSAMLRGDGRFSLDAGWQMAHRTFSAVCIVIVVVLGFHSSWHILAAWAFGIITANLIFPIGLKCRPVFLFRQKLYKIVLPLVLIDFVTVIYFRSDMMMLQWLSIPQEQIGQYAAAFRLVEGVILFASPLGALLFRHMRQINNVGGALDQHILRATVLAAMLGVVVAVFFVTFATPIISLTYGLKYPEAASLLSILAWSLVFVLPNIVLTQAALALDLERHYAWAAFITASCNVTLNVIFIGHYGTQASAWATIVTEAVLAGILVYVLTKNNKRTLNPTQVILSSNLELDQSSCM